MQCYTQASNLGQFGEVFIAILQRHESAPPIQVAMKSFKNIHNCKQEANFMKEMAQLSQLVHPNIVKMYGIVLEGMFGKVKSSNLAV